MWLVFAVVQALPSALNDPRFTSLRPLSTVAMACNAAWIVTFAYGYFWIAFVVISIYLAATVRLTTLVDANVVSGLALASTVPGTWRGLLAHAVFAANASWLIVATLLQLQVTLLDEGWAPSEGFSTGLAAVVAFAACARAYARADVVWAAVAAWALLAIAANQLPDSEWGCLAQVCAACASGGAQRICARDGPPPVGWAGACANVRSTGECVVGKSDTILYAAVSGAALVALALAAGLVKGAVEARDLRRAVAAPPRADAPDAEGGAPREALDAQPAPSGAPTAAAASELPAGAEAARNSSSKAKPKRVAAAGA